jgi:flavin-binding protein dodecin
VQPKANSAQITTDGATAENGGAVVRFVELVGSSETSFSDAVRNVAMAARAQGHVVHSLEVTSSSATLDVHGDIKTFVVACRLGVVLEPPAGTRLGGGEVLPADRQSEQPEQRGTT